MSSQYSIRTAPVLSTAGAIPVKNEKGEVSMQKVKVPRYVSGKRPDYAPRSSSEDDSAGEEPFSVHPSLQHDSDREEEENEFRPELVEQEKLDPRMRRLLTLDRESGNERADAKTKYGNGAAGRHHESESEGEKDDEEEEELDEEERERRRALLRREALRKRQDEEELLSEQEEKEEGETDETESEEYTESEEEETPRFKPVYVRKDERVTVKVKEENTDKQEQSKRRSKQERRKQTLKMLENEIRKERAKAGATSTSGGESENESNMPKLTDVNTDDEANEAAEFEAWKIRELKRMKRDREEREVYRKEQKEIERLRNMTAEERRQELKLKPKQVINKADKGRYKFLQKYYHRGAFYLDKEDEILKRDVSKPTLEDLFDKTTLPKVMQVKNFGRSGQTKYTHLVDQDTTSVDSAWASETAQTHKFYTTQAAGVRQVFEKPTYKRSNRNKNT